MKLKINLSKPSILLFGLLINSIFSFNAFADRFCECKFADASTDIDLGYVNLALTINSMKDLNKAPATCSNLCKSQFATNPRSINNSYLTRLNDYISYHYKVKNFPDLIVNGPLKGLICTSERLIRVQSRPLGIAYSSMSQIFKSNVTTEFVIRNYEICNH